MAAAVITTNGETAQHARLKRLAFLWAQAQGFSACAMEVNLPKCRYRADVAAYRPHPSQIGSTAVFECKQALCDLRRDNCRTTAARQQLKAMCKRRTIFESSLRIHYPSLWSADSLFPEFDSQSFAAIGHRGYARLLRELRGLRNRLYDCAKFDKLIRYRCANLFFLVVPEGLFRDPEIPVGWGALVESGGALLLARKPVYYETTEENRIRLLQRIAVRGTQCVNRKLHDCSVSLQLS